MRPKDFGWVLCCWVTHFPYYLCRICQDLSSKAVRNARKEQTGHLVCGWNDDSTQCHTFIWGLQCKESRVFCPCFVHFCLSAMADSFFSLQKRLASKSTQGEPLFSSWDEAQRIFEGIHIKHIKAHSSLGEGRVWQKRCPFDRRWPEVGLMLTWLPTK